MIDKRPLFALLLVVVLIGSGYWFSHRNAVPLVDTGGTYDTTTVTAGSAADAASPVATGALVDWPAGLERVTALENAAFRAPDPGAAAGFMTQACTCYKDTVSRLSTLRAAGRKVNGDNITLTETAFVKQTGNQVVIFTQPKPAGFSVVDTSGKTVETSPKAPGLPFLYTLERGSDGQWRIADRSVAKMQS